MSAPFALWISHAFPPPTGRSGTVFEGVGLGRCPEIGQALSYWAPFCLRIPLHFSGLASAPRGRESSAITVTIRETIPSPGLWVGGLIFEAGIRIWPLAAALREECAGTELAAGRVRFSGEQCWGLVRRRRKQIALMLIGGPDWRTNPWDSFESIQLESGRVWPRQSIEPVMFGALPWGYAFPVLRRYNRGDIGDGILVDPAGAISADQGRVTVVADDLPFRASLVQQENGLAQFLLEGQSGPLETVNLPAAA